MNEASKFTIPDLKPVAPENGIEKSPPRESVSRIVAGSTPVVTSTLPLSGTACVDAIAVFGEYCRFEIKSDGVSGSEIDGVSGSEIDGVSGSETDGVSGSEIDGVSGSETDGVSGSEIDGVSDPPPPHAPTINVLQTTARALRIFARYIAVPGGVDSQVRADPIRSSPRGS